MQSASKTWWMDLKVYRSKDVPWRVKCRRMVSQVHSVFCFGSENGCWSETKALSRLFKMKNMEDARTARTARKMGKDEAHFSPEIIAVSVWRSMGWAFVEKECCTDDSQTSLCLEEYRCCEETPKQ